MTAVAVLIPVLGRPANVAPLLESLLGASPDVRPMFLCTPGDSAELDAVRVSGHDHLVVSSSATAGDYPRKINAGFRRALDAGAEWVFLGADDLRFWPGWLEAALAAHRRTGACVVGTNDKGNQRVIRGLHSTHSLVHADYLECGTADEHGKLLHEGYSHQFCTPPESPVWMGDLSFRPISRVRPGDEVIGWERRAGDAFVGGRRPGRAPLKRLCRATVTRVSVRKAHVVRVAMESGRELRCTDDHLWLNAAWSPSSHHPAEYVTARIGRTLLHVIDPSDPVKSWDERRAGWLGGIFDGEGSGAPNPQIAQSRAYNPEVYERICETLDYFGIPYTRASDRVWLTGGRRALVRFLAVAQPYKRASFDDYMLGGARFGLRDRVIAVEPDGYGPVISLSTSTGNYTAWGYASHNCDDEFVQTAVWRRTFTSARDSVVEHLHPHWQKGEHDATYDLAMAGFDADRRLYYARRRMWGR